MTSLRSIAAPRALSCAALVVTGLGCAWEDPPPPRGLAVDAGAPSGDCAPRTHCSGECVDTASDPAHCGGCDEACAEGELCSSGACVDACAAPSIACGGGCVDVQTSALHCGECDAACSTDQTCQLGTCVCLATLTACAGECVNTTTDARHCGECDRACDPGRSCRGGMCR